MMSGLERFYCTLLYLYPSSFRTEYGPALTETYMARIRGMSGPGRTLRGVGIAVTDVMHNALARLTGRSCARTCAMPADHCAALRAWH
jgi:hypothetical protein